MGGSGAFAGLQVLDFSQGVAGPHCAALLAAHGADVVKVEPPGGDWIRSLGAAVADQSASLLVYNRGKRGIALDLKQAGAVQVMQRLAARADVVVESFRPGVADRLGVGFQVLSAGNPRLVYCAVSGFGQHGPLAGRACTDTVAQAFSGLMSVNQGMDGVPHKVHTTLIDHVTGLYAFAAVAAALHQRGAQRQARYLDVSLMQSAAALQAPKVVEHFIEQGPPAPINVPAGSYRASDGWLVLTLVKERDFVALCRVLDLPALAADERFQGFAARARNRDVLVAQVAGRIATRRVEDWLAGFEREGVLGNAIHHHGDYLAHEHVQASGSVADVPMHDRQVPVPALPGVGIDTRPAPDVGQHSLALLAELGYEDEAVRALLASGAVHTRRQQDSEMSP